MFKRSFAMAVIVAFLAVAPATRAAAQADAVPSQVNRNENPVSDGVSRAGPADARSQNRNIQIALNYFGFPAGSPDGILGPVSRAAISQFQSFMGYPDTGELTRPEWEFLISSHERILAEGADATQMAARGKSGARAALKAYEHEAAAPAQAAADKPKAPPAEPVTSAAKEAAAPEPQATPAVVAAAPALKEPAVDPAAQLPRPIGKPAKRSLALTCTEGAAMMDPAKMANLDADSVLSGQFCLARADAISHGAELADQMQGTSAVQILEQCEAFGKGLKEQIAGLSLQPQPEVMKDVGGFVMQSGLSPAQLSGMAKVCLSVGYRTDNMGMALASALLLTILGEPVYAELVGHHLSQGYGASKRPDLALAWYQTSLDAIEKGAQPVFQPAQSARPTLIRRAANQAGGRSGGAMVPAAALPSAPGDN